MNSLLCDGCGIRKIHCVCDLLEPVPARTPMVVIRHAAERYKSSNTGILLSHLLPDCTVIDHGGREPPLDHLFFRRPNLVLVYPGEARPLPPNPTLVLLDGSWPQVRKMYHRFPGATSLPCLSLPPPPEHRLRMRVSPSSEGMSTLEAAAAALALIEDPALAAPLLRVYDRMTERQLKQRGRIPT